MLRRLGELKPSTAVPPDRFMHRVDDELGTDAIRDRRSHDPAAERVEYMREQHLPSSVG